MVANPHVSLEGVNVKKALIFLCGIDSKDFNEVDKTGIRLADRIPEFDQWKKVFLNEKIYVLNIIFIHQ